MGQKFSIEIQVDHEEDADTSVVAGTSLKGNIRLHVKRKLDPTKLILHFCGKETSIISRTTKSSLRQENIIARAITTLKDTRGAKLPRGIYTIPFDFVLPSSLPSSVRFPDGSSNRSINGRIQYCLAAELGEFRLEKEVKVASAPLPSDIVPCLVEPTTHQVQSFGILNKGLLWVGASVENSRVGRGESLQISVACRNETSVDLDRVRVKLVELIEYKAHTKSASLKVELSKIKDVDLPGLNKTRSPRSEVQHNIREERRHGRSAIYHFIYHDLVSRHNQFELVVPEQAKDTYDGSLIKISHYLKITFFTKALAQNPFTKIPIVIGNPHNNAHRTAAADRQPLAPVATIIFDEDFSDTYSTIEVGSRAEFIPMADAVLVDPYYDGRQEQSPLGLNETFLLPPHQTFDPTAPTESMILEHDFMRRAVNDESTVGSDTAHLTPQRRFRLGDPQYSPPRHTGYSPYQMYNGSTLGQRERLRSYSYDTESGMTSVTDTPQRLAAVAAPSPYRDGEAQLSLERLLQELRGSIHDYEVVATRIRDPKYKLLFTMLTPEEFRCIISHVGMSHQVQVALLLAKQLVYNSAFTCAHCVGALQKTNEYFRSNMVETLLPYCSDFGTNFLIIQAELSDWEKVLTKQAFDMALR